MALLDDMLKQVNDLKEGMGGFHKEAKTAHEEVDDLNSSITRLGRIIKDVSIAEFTRLAVDNLFKYIGKKREELEVTKKTYAVQVKAAEQARARFEAHSRMPGVHQSVLKLMKGEAESAEASAASLGSQVVSLGKWVGTMNTGLIIAKAVGAAFTIANAALQSTLSAVRSYQQALAQANTAIDSRFNLIRQTLDVQRNLGASTQTMAESVEALVEYGHDMSPAFQQNLRVVTMMRDGLQVSARSAAELVTVFTRQLKTSAMDVANVITTIAQQTALSAEKATQFAVQIGRALRGFGPNFKSEAAGISKVVLELAGRVQELGGNADSVMKFYRTLAAGTAEGAFVRGVSRTNAAALGGAGGTENALKGFANYITSVIGKAPSDPRGLEQYMVRLHSIGEQFGFAAEELVDLQEAVQNLNKPLTEQKALEKAYRDQTAQLSKSFTLLRNETTALLHRALLPLIPPITKGVRFLGQFVGALAKTDAAIDATLLALSPAMEAAHLMGLTIHKLGQALRSAGKMMSVGLEFMTKHIFTMAGFLGPKFPMFVLIAKELEDISKTVKKWYAESSQDEVQVVKVEPNTQRDETEKAARSLRDVMMSLGSDEQVEKVVEAFAKQSEARGYDPSKAVNEMVTMARQGVHDAIAVEHLTRTTTKTDADRAEDARHKDVLAIMDQTAAILTASYEEQAKTRKAAQVQVEQQRNEENRKKIDTFWHSLPPYYMDSLSNKNSFRINP